MSASIPHTIKVLDLGHAVLENVHEIFPRMKFKEPQLTHHISVYAIFGKDIFKFSMNRAVEKCSTTIL